MQEYRVLARKCRPQTFEEVAGQGHVVRTLQNAISQRRVAHAFLFSGPRGVGKTSVARILAKALNCEYGPAPVPCNTCSHCLEITNGNAIDVREIDGASNRGIDEIRELRENVKFSTVSCRYKIYIIDEVHMLTREAFNALLKTLEEPPGHVIFIFATTETNKVPATIRSRCQCFDFRRISQKQIKESLRSIAVSEGISISDGALSWIAEAGDGSLRDSQSIFDQVISYSGTDISDASVEEILGRSDRRFLLPLSEAIFAHDAGRSLKIVDEAYYYGLDMRYFYQALLDHFRNLLLVRIVKENSVLVDISTEDKTRLAEQVKGCEPETIQRLLEVLMAEEENARRSHNPRLNLEVALCRMAYMVPIIPVEGVIARMEELERRLAGGVAAEKEAVSPSRVASRVEPAAKRYETDTAPAARETDAVYGSVSRQVGRTDKGDIDSDKGWDSFREFLKKHDPALSAKLQSGKCLSLGEGSLRIGFEKGYIFYTDVLGQREKLAGYCRQFWGHEMALDVEVVESSEGGNGSRSSALAERNSQNREIRREVLSHPLVLKILDVFPGAEVRDVKVLDRQIAPSAAFSGFDVSDDGQGQDGLPEGE